MGVLVVVVLFKGPFTQNINSILHEEWDRQKKEKEMQEKNNIEALEDIANLVFGRIEKIIDKLIPENGPVFSSVNNIDYEPLYTPDVFKTFVDDMKKISDEEKAKAKEIEDLNNNRIDLTYEEIQHSIDNSRALHAAKITNDIDTILCITRGGLIPAGMVAYKLGIKNVIVLQIQTYEGEDEQELGETQLTKLSKKDIRRLSDSKGVLIVDDIVDSGQTIYAADAYIADLHAAGKLENTNFRVFSLVNKSAKLKDSVISLFNYVGDERWVYFPWDV